MKRQTTAEKTIFADHIYLTQDLHLEYMKNSQNSTVKNQTIQLENGKKHGKKFTENGKLSENMFNITSH